MQASVLEPQARELRRRLLRAPSAPLAVVAAGFAMLQVALGPARVGLGWDETVYVSQVAPHVPAAYFSAPRSRGMPVLVAPVAGFTTSTVALRAYLLVLGAVGLYLAFRLWLSLLPRAVVVLAAVLFAATWPALFYGSEAMPNYWIALLAVAAVAATLRCRRAPATRWYVVVGACVAVMGLIRPSDAVWFAAPLVVVALAGWRRHRWLLVTLLAALVVGIAPWVVEAYTRFGGLRERLHLSSLNEGGLRPHVGFVYQARALYGPLLCRPCTHASKPLVLDVWWVLLPIAVVAAVALVRGTPRFPALFLPAACAALVAAPYLFLVGYAAPRFLLPAYALAAFPVADLIVRFILGWRHRLPAILVATGVLVFVGGQAAAAALQVPVQQVDRHNYAVVARQLHALGIRAPCTLDGVDAPPVAYYAGCSSVVPHGGRGPHGEAEWIAYAHRVNLAVVVQVHTHLPSYARRWPSYRVPGTRKHTWVIYLPP